MASSNYERPSTFFRWATDIVNDPTTLQDNRTAITVALQDSGWVPFGVKPARQKMNQSFYENGRWSEWSFHLSAQLFQKNKVNITPGAIKPVGTELQIVNGSGITAILDHFTDVTRKLTVDVVGGFDKDQNLTWVAGDGGLRSAGAVTDQFVYVFMIATQTGIADIITDTDINGTNVKANAAVISGSYEYIRRIMTLSYIDTGGGDRWRPFTYGHNDMIWYQEEFSGAGLVIGETLATYQQKTIVDAGGNLFPTENTVMECMIRENSGAQLPVVKSYTSVPTAEEMSPFAFFANEAMRLTLQQTESSLSMKSLAAGASSIQFQALGYKNPESE